MSEKVAVFIDWANAFRHTNVDVFKFRQFLNSLGTIHVAYAYMADFTELNRKDDPTESRRSPRGFWYVLSQQGFRLRLKKVKVIQRREGGDDLHKADWDVGMTIDILKTAQSGKVDEVILFSGDSDFEPLIREIQNPPCLIRVTVVAPGKKTASEIRNCADKFVDLDEHISGFSRSYEVRSRRETVEEALVEITEDPAVPVIVS